MKNKALPLRQDKDNLAASAEAADLAGPGVGNARCVADRRSAIEQALSESARESHKPQQPTCQQTLWLSFFFDGTGNNREADIGTREHSNVARLFRAHKLNDEHQGRYAFYIPGIGTYFKEIGDEGGGVTGPAFAAKGEDRLVWAQKQFEEKLHAAEQRAMNPVNKITGIHVAIFGFSRGAALARAFARRLASNCSGGAGQWRLNRGNHPIRIYFMGLFDTVASVGVPMAANNFTLGTRDDLPFLAFGEPGADPAPGPLDGHGDWAGDLRIPEMVEECVQMAAAHEMRNSFPLDSLNEGSVRAPNCIEVVYPGAHSNVGGGYRPGEGGKSVVENELLSMLPLRDMHNRALRRGVPFKGLSAPDIKDDFTVSPTLVSLFTHYMSQAGWGGRPIGQMVLDHMRSYFAWRFRQVREQRAAHASQQPTQTEQRIAQMEQQARQERTAGAAKVKALKEDPQRLDAVRRLDYAERRYNRALMAHARYGTPIPEATRRELSDAQTTLKEANDPYLKEQAKLDTLPSIGLQRDRSAALNALLMRDAETLWNMTQRRPGTRIRPHYRALLDAYVAEFVQNNGLRDPQIIAFFDNYVHDSLADFDKDDTLPSDPRVIYVGGDVKLRYARSDVGERKERAA
jgi:hypothetical protein